MTQRRITIVTAQLLGYDRTGGVGTATSFLALGLARAGHYVQTLYIGERGTQAIDPGWAEIYEEAGVAIRLPAPSVNRVMPRPLAPARAVERALCADPPDVVISHEFGAPAYTCLRLRQLGLAFVTTLFVVFCHGTRRWVKEVSGNPRVPAEVLDESTLERATVELADAAVSPSEFMLRWMRCQGWRLPPVTRVIPLLRRPDQWDVSRSESRATGDRVQRLVFFGRLEELKGLRPFAAGLNALEPELLRGVEVEFIGRTTKHWSTDRVAALLSDATRRSLRRVSFESDLDQHQALERLGRPGTLAVIPSLGDNSPNTVYECLERGIPFIASDVGGIPELIAAEDRARALFEPTTGGVEQALRRALQDSKQLQRPVRPAFDPATSLREWSEIVAMPPATSWAAPVTPPAVDVVVVRRNAGRALRHCLAAVEGQSYPETRVVVESSREAGLRSVTAEWLLFLDEEDVPQPELVETLVAAQAASKADVVSCGLLLGGDGPHGTEHLFVGEPGALGVLGNGYGTVALIRRSLLTGVLANSPDRDDADWPLLARLALDDARIVSVPLPLVTRRAKPGSLEDEPAAALLVVEQFERALPESLGSLARLVAGLAADAGRPLSAAPGGMLGRSLLRPLRRRP